MNNNLKINIFNHFGRLPTAIAGNVNAMLSVKARPLLAKVIKAMASPCRVVLRKSKVLAVFLMVNRLVYIRNRSGLKGLTLYLKGCFVIFQQSLGGHLTPDTAKVAKLRVSRNNAGLPRIIPRTLRYEIRRGDTRTMKLVSCILNVYREIKFPGTPNLSTITAPFSGDVSVFDSVAPMLPSILDLFLKRRNALESMQGGRPLFIIWKASPGMIKEPVFGASNYSTHPHNLYKALLALRNRPPLWTAFMKILHDVNHEPLLQLINFAEENGLMLPGQTGALGKLHAKEEPAGKVRIFAMVDAWTQWALYPLHRFIFTCLRSIPQDGTFEQDAPLKALLSRKPKELYSLDLTAATDRLPLRLQIMVLTYLISEEFAASWAKLLVGRSYGFHQLGYDNYHGNYKYATGQPMGAYSSWAMLALTHHLLVQIAAIRAKAVPLGTWFTEYAVLGDDLVIADKRVADAYLQLLKEMGMEVNLYKSLLSDTGRCLEFAKRTIYIAPDGVWTDISPIPMKEMAAAQSLLPALVQFGVKYQLTLSELLKAFGFGWRNLAELNKPLGKLSSQIRTIVLGLSLPKTIDDAVAFFNMGSPRLKKVVNDMVQIGIDFKLSGIAKIVPRVYRKLVPALLMLANKDNLIDDMASTAAKGIIERQSALADLSPEQPFYEDAWLTVVRLQLGSSPQYFGPPYIYGETFITGETILPLPKEFGQNLREWYSLMWALLFLPALLSYIEAVQDALFNVEGMAGKHRSNPMLVLPSFHDMETNLPYGFFHRYWDLLETLNDLASASPAVLAFTRPEGLEGLSSSYSGVTPIHLRYYRMWSAFIQGSIPTLNIGMKTSLVPNRVLPHDGPSGLPGGE